MMRTEEDLRAVYVARVAAPGVTDLTERVIYAHVGVGSRPAARARSRTWVSVAAAVAAVLLVVAAVAALGGGRDPAPPGPAVPQPAPTVWNTASPQYQTAWQYGPGSLRPSAPYFYELAGAGLGPTGQSFVYQSASYGFRDLEIAVYRPTLAARTAITRLAAVRIGNKSGAYGTSAGPGAVVEQDLGPDISGRYRGSVSGSRYGVVEVPSNAPDAFVTWPYQGRQWVMLRATLDQGRRLMSAAQLSALARAVTPRRDDHAAPVRVGHLPRGLRFTGSWADPVHTGAHQFSADTALDGGDLRGMTFGYRSEAPTKSPSGVLNIDVSYDPKASAPLSNRPIKELPPKSTVGPSPITGPWRRTRVRGHFAWLSPNAVLIQWNDRVQIAVTTVNTSGPRLSQRDLLDAANSLTVPRQVTLGHGYPLRTSVPAGALTN